MSLEIVGSARRSSLLSTFGVGALLPVQDDSVMLCGLDEWPKRGEEVIEPRLAASLGVRTLRMPPTDGGLRGDVPAVRFPEYVFCSSCRRLGPWWDLQDRRSGKCSRCPQGTLVPSRFVACCTAGHIDDFPYWSWAHGQQSSSSGDSHDLTLQARGASSALGDLYVRCSCGRARSLAGAFQVAALVGVKRCQGRRPWLPGSEDEDCTASLRTLQRGSSNVWFGLTRSTISIPSVAHRAADFVAAHLSALDPDSSADEIARLLSPPPGCTREDVAAAINAQRTPALSAERPTQADLRIEEYKALVTGSVEGDDERLFLCRAETLDNSPMPRSIGQVSRVSRLREVRALHGFTRVLPSMSEDGEQSSAVQPAPLTVKSQPDWLPAIEVHGEGIFLRLDEDRIASWEETPFAAGRVHELIQAQRLTGAAAPGGLPTPTARGILLHSFAHALLDELALTSGYPAASLRERIYDESGQAGVLIYTASADSAGSLGGVASQSKPDRLAQTIKSALTRAAWCTADPVCMESVSSGVNGMNLAACHACLLLPETSCERYNTGLDRAVLIGVPTSQGSYSGGYFTDVLHSVGW